MNSSKIAAIFLLVFGVLLWLATGASAVSAQFLSDFGAINADDFQIKVKPEFPQPFEIVEVAISSFLVNVSLVNTTWFVNDDVFKNGVGVKNVQVPVGSSGELTKVDVQIILGDGSIIKKNVRIVPGSVDILWQATDSYVPPFYKGKALPSSEASVRVVAMPEGGQNAPLSYTWSHYNKRVSDRSGYQRTSFEARQHFFEQSLDVGVEVYNRQGFALAKREVSIPVFNPKPIIEITQNGLAERFHGSKRSVPGSGIAFFKIIPFFFSTEDGRNLLIDWSPSVSAGGPSAGQTRLDWVSTSGVVGNLGVTIEHFEKILQIKKMKL